MLSYVVGLGEVVTVARPRIAVDSQSQKREDAEAKANTKLKVNYVPSLDQVELKRIRMRMKMTKQAFANALNMKQCTLDSYEYGKTKGVPKDVMNKAKKLQQKQGNDVIQKMEALEGQAMSIILDAWALKLNVSVDNLSVLAKLLDTTPTTIRRWRDNKVRPDGTRLAMLSSIAESGPEGARKTIAKNALKKLKLGSAASNGESFIPLDVYQACLIKISDALNTSQSGLALVAEFNSAVGLCHKIEGKKSFIQMNTSSFDRFVKRLMSALSNGNAENPQP